MKNKEMKVKAMSMAVAMSMVVGLARQPSCGNRKSDCEGWNLYKDSPRGKNCRG